MRIKPREVSDCPWYLRPFLWNQRRKFGKELESSLMWARSPGLFLGVAFLYGMIDHKLSPIDPALRSLVTVRVSQINWCAFCVDLNSAALLERGASMEKLSSLSQWREGSLFDDRERAALGYAEAMTRSDIQVGDQEFETLRQYFSDEAIVELTALIAFQNMSSKFNAALDVRPQGFCRVLRPEVVAGSDAAGQSVSANPGPDQS
ncbi:carboxymuconolactone decarboxylase family protein [Bradyrhizobium sp.]|uniref:carboxymuconolactone decarboxylase family protein n=1 Tax=Bradyrhizobium sp. TaxID=376 RepID=UPI0040380A7E